MDCVNGVQAIIMQESTADQSKSNSSILLLQSEKRWTSMDIQRLKEQLTQKQQLIVLPVGTNVVVCQQEDVKKQEELTNNLPVTKECNSTCKFWTKPWTYNKCVDCKRNALVLYKGITDNWEARK